MTTVDLNTLGAIVSIVVDGRRIYSSWLGDTVCVYARFSIEPTPGIPFNILRSSMVEAFTIDSGQPEGTYETICFLRIKTCEGCDA